MINSRRYWIVKFAQILVLGSGTLFFITGCNNGDRPPLGYVKGNVKIDGQPLSGVIVTFAPEEGRPGVGVTDKDGNYELKYTASAKGTKVGNSTVTFAGQTGVAASHAIPAKYQSGTEFQREVKSGRNEFNFELVSDGKVSKPIVKKGIVLD